MQILIQMTFWSGLHRISSRTNVKLTKCCSSNKCPNFLIKQKIVQVLLKFIWRQEWKLTQIFSIDHVLYFSNSKISKIKCPSGSNKTNKRINTILESWHTVLGFLFQTHLRVKTIDPARIQAKGCVSVNTRKGMLESMVKGASCLIGYGCKVVKYNIWAFSRVSLL